MTAHAENVLWRKTFGDVIHVGDARARGLARLLELAPSTIVRAYHFSKEI
jgi:hypothetical protein